MKRKSLKTLLQKIALDTVRSELKPMKVQTAVYQGDGKVKIDQQLDDVGVVIPMLFTGFLVEAEGYLDVLAVSGGGPLAQDLVGARLDVKGELTLKEPLEEGDTLKVIKQDGVDNKFFVVDKVEIDDTVVRHTP